MNYQKRFKKVKKEKKEALACQKKRRKKAYNLQRKRIFTNHNGGLELWQFRTLDYSDMPRNYKGGSSSASKRSTN